MAPSLSGKFFRRHGRASGPRLINWTRLGPEDQAANLLTLLNTNNWIFVALAGKTESTTTPLLIEGSTEVMTSKGKAFRKMKWWQSGDDELANPYNGTKGVDFYWTRTDPGIMEIPLLLRLIYAVDGC